MKKRIWRLLAILAVCGASPDTQSTAPLVAPDPPSRSPREAELAKRVSAIVDAFTDTAAVFSRDGKKVVFVSNRDGLRNSMSRTRMLPSRPRNG